MIFPSEFAICFKYQNVEETEIEGCAQLWYLRLQNRSTVATSEKKSVSKQVKSDFAIAYCMYSYADSHYVYSYKYIDIKYNML